MNIFCYFIGKPTPDVTNITLGVTCTTGIELSTTIIAYPEPINELQYENGTRNEQMIINVTENELNNFTVRIRQDNVEKTSFGIYHLKASNIFGETTVTVNVIKQSKKISYSFLTYPDFDILLLLKLFA